METYVYAHIYTYACTISIIYVHIACVWQQWPRPNGTLAMRLCVDIFRECAVVYCLGFPNVLLFLPLNTYICRHISFIPMHFLCGVCMDVWMYVCMDLWCMYECMYLYIYIYPCVYVSFPYLKNDGSNCVNRSVNRAAIVDDSPFCSNYVRYGALLSYFIY